MAAILKFFKRRLLPNRKSKWTETWWEASKWNRDSELLKSFRSGIQDGRHGGNLEILQTTSPPKQPSWNSSNDISSQTVSPTDYGQQSWNSSNDISSQTFKLDWAKTWWEAYQWHRDSDLLKSLRSDIQDGRHGGNLEILQTTSPPKPQLKLDGRHWERYRDSELLKWFCSDIQDGRRGSDLEILQTTSPPEP